MAQLGNPTFTVKDKASADRAAKGIENQWKMFVSQAEKAIAPAMEVMGEEMIKETLPITPKKTGALRASHDMATQIGGNEVLLEVSFGNKVSGFERDPSTYAIAAHQRTNVAFRFTPGTRSHFLKIGGHKITDNQGEQILANELKKRLGL